MPVRKVDPAAPLMPGLEEADEFMSQGQQLEAQQSQATRTALSTLPAYELRMPASGEHARLTSTRIVHCTRRARTINNLTGSFWAFDVLFSDGSSAWVRYTDAGGLEVLDDSLVQA